MGVVRLFPSLINKLGEGRWEAFLVAILIESQKVR